MLRRSLFVLLALATFGASAARAQSRPLPIESADGPGAGTIVVTTTADYARDVHYTLSGLGGDLWRVGLIRLDFGLSDAADFELSGGLRDHLDITSRTPAVLSNLLTFTNPASTGAFDDIIVGTRVRVVKEGEHAPSFAIRVATRLPNAKHPSGLGQDTMDFYASAIAARSVRALEFTVNAGYGILGDPLRGNRHVPSLLYSGAVACRVARPVFVLANVDGRTGPQEPGLEARAIARVGLVTTLGATRVEVDGTRGMTDRDGGYGFSVSVGYAFHAFNVPR